MSLITSDLPHFFGATGSALTESVSRALSNLLLEGTSEFQVVRDEVVFCKTWSLVYGLLPDASQPAVLGGMFPNHMVPVQEGEEESMAKRDKKDLAPIVVCTVVKPVNRKGDCYCIQMTPRSHKQTAADEFHEMGEILQACCLYSPTFEPF